MWTFLCASINEMAAIITTLCGLLLFTPLCGAQGQSKDCTDTDSFCKEYKRSGFCNPNSQYFMYLKYRCQKTCGFCSPPPVSTTKAVPTIPGCVDKSTYCSSYKLYCNDPSYIDYLQIQCKSTCNFCHITTQPPPTTQLISMQPYTGPDGRTLQPGCGKKGPGHTRIVGGSNSKPGDWPWQVNIDYKYNSMNPGHHCGGTLITEEWVLSAAHCFYDDLDINNYWLKLGEHDIKTNSSWEQRFDIQELHLHPKYDHAIFDYDLALIKLSRNASFNNRVRTACVPGQNTSFDYGFNCYVSGWGHLKEYGKGPAILQQAKVPLIDHSICANSYKDYNGNNVTPRMMCAGFKNGTIDTCQGDSGGPLVCSKYDKTTGEETWFLWGTISWGVGCAREGLYGVYSNLKVMRPWVDTVVFNTKV